MSAVATFSAASYSLPVCAVSPSVFTTAPSSSSLGLTYDSATGKLSFSAVPGTTYYNIDIDVSGSNYSVAAPEASVILPSWLKAELSGKSCDVEIRPTALPLPYADYMNACFAAWSGYRSSQATLYWDTSGTAFGKTLTF
jgi:hypothetical protein